MKYAEYKPQVCVRGVFRSARLCKYARGFIARRKNILHSDKYNPLVSARKGKNKGKYIRLEHKTGESP